MNARQIVEAVLFASDAPLTADEIARADSALDEDQVEEALELLRAEYDDAGRSFEIVRLAEGYQVLTRPEFAPYLERFDNVPRPSRLSVPALETLAIIAYRQPISRIEIEYIRGVGVSGVIKTLVDRRLIDVVERGEGLGRPLLYGTTLHFLEHFGFRSVEDLPRPEELPIVLRERIPLGPESDDEGPEPHEHGEAHTLDEVVEEAARAAAPSEDVAAESVTDDPVGEHAAEQDEETGEGPLAETSEPRGAEAALETASTEPEGGDAPADDPDGSRGA